jgi:hypothetical protein
MITTLDAITNELEFGVPKKNTNHYSIHVSAPGTERIMIQSPKMELRENVNLMSDSYADMVCKDTDFLNALKAVRQEYRRHLRRGRSGALRDDEKHRTSTCAQKRRGL